MAKNVIINADDFGYATGINRGIAECHQKGVLTSTSFMVTGHAVAEAVAMSKDLPDLAIGLHWDICGEDERYFDCTDEKAVREEFKKQYEEFLRLFGRRPTHIDSHRHSHRADEVFPIFREMVEPLGIPLRGDGQVRFIGGFYAQWEWQVTNLEYVSVKALRDILLHEVNEGWTEISCHPGYVTPDWKAVYQNEREEEIKTLCDPRIRATLSLGNLLLRSYADYPRTIG